MFLGKAKVRRNLEPNTSAWRGEATHPLSASVLADLRSDQRKGANKRERGLTDRLDSHGNAFQRSCGHD